MKNLFQLFLLFCINNVLFAQTTVKPNNIVQNYAEELMAKESLEGAAFSFYAKDMSSGVIVADYNGKMSIPSASTMKLVTTA
ncbi:D-alanyl-D-alanine carboxypeptidase, partial [Crocinitomix sp.]|nr:D-alanyl-D-alanine carboxypeptidase [Crocinitomix sp.]